MTRPAIIPLGSWPRRMCAELAAGYCGEPSVEAFLSRVGKEYPHPRIKEGRRQLWLRDDLDRAILPGRGRGLVMFTKPLPRFVIAKRLSKGSIAFYFNVPSVYRRLGCTIPNEPLGTDYVIACGDNGEGGRAAALNGL